MSQSTISTVQEENSVKEEDIEEEIKTAIKIGGFLISCLGKIRNKKQKNKNQKNKKLKGKN